MRELKSGDRVGLGWRSELAASIFVHLDQIDVVEVIIDDYLSAPVQKLRPLKTLSSQIPVLYHGVGLGLASSHPVDEHRLDRLARTLAVLAPEHWSEHLAFVRAGGREIGHLAAPPRTESTVEGTCRNIRRVEQIVGSKPSLENIATLIDPPASLFSEGEWISRILKQAHAPLLLDLHNLYANALNFGFDPFSYLRTFPLDCVSVVHLSGGKWIQEPPRFANAEHSKRLLDDHKHNVPAGVFDLLRTLASEVSQPLTVIVERDGDYPAFEVLLKEIQAARAALLEGRQRLTQRVEVQIEHANHRDYPCPSLHRERISGPVPRRSPACSRKP